MTVLVTKANGAKQPFSKLKIIDTCLRMGATPENARQIAERIEKNIYEGISTQQILRMIFRYMRKHKPAIKNIYDLKKGLSLMNPKPEFEIFVQLLLANNGYQVEPSQILRGKCVEHEVDGIARKDGVTFFVEAKHHFSYHTLTGLDESRIAQAVLEDVNDAFSLDLSRLRIDHAMIVTNTRYSTHATQYGTCKNILQIGWTSPVHKGLKDMILEAKLYPASCLKSLPETARLKLVDSGIVLIKQLARLGGDEMADKTGLHKDAAWKIVEKARETVNVL
ncbi:MAG: ATP cone domain-containing protein [Candidatus Bathyarchaeota archaeon]|nr:ATP cone domain-containing protein [Candidatus Bathyarchaeota archaeon]